MNVAILTPIPPEHKAILAHLGLQTERAVDGSRYVSGHYEGKHGTFYIVTQQTGSGNSTVALATEKVIRNFQPVVVILAGIAGGVKDVAIGDVVVGTKFYGYESGKETETGFVVRPEAGSYSKDLLATAQSVAGNDRWQEKVKGGVPGAKEIFGPIASGDKITAATEGGHLSPAQTIVQRHHRPGDGVQRFWPGHAIPPRHPVRQYSGYFRPAGGQIACRRGGGTQERAAANMAVFIFELLEQLDIFQFKIMGMDLKELAKQMLETTLPITKMEAAGQDFSHTASESAVALWQQVKSLLSGEYPALKNAPDDPDAKAEARIALRQALEGKAALQSELETLLREAQGSGSTSVAISKNVIDNSNIDVGGDFRTGDDYGARQENKSSDAIGGDKYVQSASEIHINHYYGKEEKATPGTEGKDPDRSPASADYIQNLQRLIASGRPDAAIQSVIDFTASRDKEANLEANTMAERWQALARKQRLGTIRNDDANIERSQIVTGLLDLVGRL